MSDDRSERRLRTAIVGCGAIAHDHMSALRELDASVRVVGVADRSPAAASFLAERFGVESSFSDVGRLLTDVEPDVVHVLTPPHSHLDIVRQCLDSSCHVVCEKPITLSSETTESLLSHAREKDRFLIESQNLRFNDQVRRIEREIDAGRLGEIHCVDVSLVLDLTAGPFGDLNLAGEAALPGGAVHDFLPHLVYLFEHFIDHDNRGIQRASGTLANRSGNERVGYDTLDALVEHPSGRGALRIASDLGPDSFRLVVRGSVRSVETDFYNSFYRVEGGANVGKRAPIEQIVSGVGLALAGVSNVRDKLAQHGPMHGLKRLLAEFYGAVAGRNPVPISPRQVQATADSIDVLLASLHRTEARTA